MASKLTKEQNESIREFVNRVLIPRYKTIREISAQIGLGEQVLGRVMRAERGASLGTASLLAALAGTDVWEVIGMRGKSRTTSLGMVPGYAVAEQRAMEFFGDIPDEAWDLTRSMELRKLPESISPQQIAELAKAVQLLFP